MVLNWRQIIFDNYDETWHFENFSFDKEIIQILCEEEKLKVEDLWK